MRKLIRKILKIIGSVLAVILLALAGYIIYLYASYHRIEDNLQLQVETTRGTANETTNETNNETTEANTLTTGKKYSALTYNIGFGAYTPDFSFSWWAGKLPGQKVKRDVLKPYREQENWQHPKTRDFAMIEEVDLNSTRSYHVNEYNILKDCFPDYYYVFAQNYDSAFLFYPFTQPHGSSKSGIGLFSRYPVTSALRRSFPVSTSFTKFFDLDRCYSISRVSVDNGKELVIFALHMSAYGNSDAIREGQIAMLAADMQKEYEAGNYVLCGGDFNHDLKASADEENPETGKEDQSNSNSDREYESWAYPFPREELPEHFSFCLDQLSKEERSNLWNSARNADMEYIPGETYTVTLDGFIISDNIECLSYENINTGYSYSDHDPVYVEFKLK